MSTERENRSPSPFIQAMDADQRRRHMSGLAERAHEGRLTLSADETKALGEVYRLLDRIHRRHQKKLDRAAEGEAADGS